MSNESSKYYILNMFPYPSGDGLHVGHTLGYVASDIFSRYKKMKGYNVINPMGFDSFGLPAEQYAILTGQHPSITTDNNVKHYIEQMKNIDLDFDWDRKFNTSDPEYYKWTQWIFIKMFNSFYCKLDNRAHYIEDLYKYFSKNGTKDIKNYAFFKDLKYEFTAEQWNNFDENKKYKISLDYRIAYLDDIEVNWCEELKTVLANDEVKNGVSERGGYPVIKKKMKQWVLRITAYADRLLDDLDYYYQKNEDKNNKDNIFSENHLKVFKKNDLKPNLKIEERNIILAIIKHWNENKYLVIRYKKNNSRAFVTGGIESNETPEEALIREIKEETGFINIKKIEKICNTDCTFYNSIKNVNRRAFTRNYYVELENGENIEVSKEEQDILDFEWVNEDDLENTISYEEEYYPFKIFKERQNNELLGVVKVFNSTLKEGLEIENRNVILAIIKHWNEDKYLVIRYKKDNSRAFLTGGIDDNEKIEDAVIREIKEETGFINIRKIEKICNTECTFYHNRKDKNLKEFVNNYYVELENDEKIETSKEEQDILDFEWVKEEQLENIISYEEHYYPFKIYKERENNELLGVEKVFNFGFKEGYPLVKFKVICAIIKHWKEDKYLILRYPKDNSTGFLTGGIENGESNIEALVREIKEETGFVNFKRIIPICKIKCSLFVNRKNTNAEGFCSNYFVELKDDSQVEISDEERKKQTYFFVDEKDVESYLKDEDFKYVFNKIKDNINREVINWPESTKEMQKNWIGRSKGANINFKVDGLDYTITIFTSRPETIFGVTFIGISKDHEFVKKYCSKLDLNNIDCDSNIKLGINTGYFAINPISNEKIPIWISNYILSDYGTGAIMGVPQLDERDEDFSKRYNIKIKKIFEDNHFINSDFLNNLDVENAKVSILNKLEQLNIGESKTTYKLRDAIFSRQRYWGEPIPIYYKEINVDNKIEKLPFSIDEKDLPLNLPDIDDFKPTGEAPLKKAKDWKYNGYEIEVNTMPGWAGSSWYFLRYLDPNNDKEICSKDKLNEFRNVDLYLGGSEHTVGHLLYSRFYTKFLYDLGFINFEEPFKKLIHQGMILGESAIIYRINGTNKFVSSDLKNNYDASELVPIHINVNLISKDNVVDIEKLTLWRQDFKNANFILNKDKKLICDRLIEKMSKSKYNVINPDDVIKKYGSDVLRMYLMFLGPVEQQKPWNTKGIEGIARFLNKVNNIINKIIDKEEDINELKIIHKCIKNVDENTNNYLFNLSISSMMICINNLSELTNISKIVFKKYLLLLKPFAPKTVNNIWNQLFYEEDLEKMGFPKFNEEYLVENTIQYPVMINGKTRTQIVVDKNISEEEIKNIVLNNNIVQKWISTKEIKKFIVIKNKIVNVVIQ